MTKHWTYLLLSTAFLAACGSGDGASTTGGGNGFLGGGGGTGGEAPPTGPTDPVDPGTVDDTPIEDSPDSCSSSDLTCRGDVLAVSYDDTTQILSITGLPFDENPVTANYVRAPGLDVGDFDAFVNDDPDRINDYIAMYQTSPGGEVTVGVVGIEGYNFGYKGTFYRQNDEGTRPDTGLAIFTGDYAGLMDFFGDGDLRQTAGDMIVAADFTDNKIKGVVENRTFVGGAALPDIILSDANIVDGTFSGVAESFDGGDVLESGTYLGLFGGTNATVVGGVIEVVNPDFDEINDIQSRDTGVFITTR